MFGPLPPRPGKDNYQTIKGRLARKRSFRGNSMTADWNAHFDYVVWSYATVIAKWNPSEGMYYFDEGKYSNTTSHHQNLVRSYLK